MEKSRQKAAEIVHKAEKEAGAILDSLKPIEAEYRAKQAYVKAMNIVHISRNSQKKAVLWV